MKSTKDDIHKRTRNTNIDLLKLCACIGVIGLHTFKYDAAPILYYLCCFSVPVFLHPVLLKKISDRQHLLLLCISSIFIVGYQYTISNHILNTRFAEYFYDSIFVIIWVFILFTYILRLHISAKWNKYISVFCPLTFGVYIVHPLVMSSIVEKLNSIPNYTAAIYSFIIVLITSFTGVWVLNKIWFIKKYLLTL